MQGGSTLADTERWAGGSLGRMLPTAVSPVRARAGPPGGSGYPIDSPEAGLERSPRVWVSARTSPHRPLELCGPMPR